MTLLTPEAAQHLLMTQIAAPDSWRVHDFSPVVHVEDYAVLLIRILCSHVSSYQKNCSVGIRLKALLRILSSHPDKVWVFISCAAGLQCRSAICRPNDAAAKDRWVGR